MTRSGRVLIPDAIRSEVGRNATSQSKLAQLSGALAAWQRLEMPGPPRGIDRKRWRRSLVEHLADFPRQLEALRFSTRSFAGNFDFADFADAFSSEDPQLYTRVQAIERAFGRLQSYIALMSEEGANLAGLTSRSPKEREPKSQPAFEALRDAGVIPNDLCRRLVASQKSRNLFEHDYVKAQAEDVHEAVTELLDLAPDFLDRFARWVERHLIPPPPAAK